MHNDGFLRFIQVVFVPFVNIWYIGKISGECTVFGQKLKRAGLYAMLAQIVLTLLCALEVFGMIYLWTTQGAPSFDAYYPYWGEAQGAALAMTKYLSFYNGFIRSIIQVVYEIMMFIILMGIYKKYSPSSHFILSVVSLFVPLSRCVILFVIRNKEKVDYDAYMRKKREEYMRSRGFTQYGAPYGTPYGYNPNPNPQQPREPEDPFEEFNQGKNGGGDHDDFFS